MQPPPVKPIVVKYGGHAMTDPVLRASFAEDAAKLQEQGAPLIVVHGGGPQINAMLARLGIDSEFRGGLRVTTPEVMDVVGLVLVGDVQRQLVAEINVHAPCAVGISGEDAGLMAARRRGALVDGTEVDIGRVGEVELVRPGLLDALMDGGYLPVVSSVARDAQGLAYNVNADTAAAAIAAAVGAERLIVLTDVDGLYASWPDPGSLLESATADEVEELLPSLDAGMAPKAEACLHAVRGGVAEAVIIDGRTPHCLMESVTGVRRPGTTIRPDAP